MHHGLPLTLLMPMGVVVTFGLTATGHGHWHWAQPKRLLELLPISNSPSDSVGSMGPPLVLPMDMGLGGTHAPLAGK